MFLSGISGTPSWKETPRQTTDSLVGLHFPVITGIPECSLEELEEVAGERMVWASPLITVEDMKWNAHYDTFNMICVLIYVVICFTR